MNLKPLQGFEPQIICPVA